MIQRPRLADPSRYQVERMWAYLVADEMETGGGDQKLTPIAAREQALARLESEFSTSFPGVALPIRVEEPAGAQAELDRDGEEMPLPGGLTSGDGSYWIIAARPEELDGLTMFEDDPITYQELRGVADSYDPRFRQATVILPNGDGPTHWMGEFTRWLPGVVRAVQFDGYHLWTLVESFGEFEWSVLGGARQRSVKIWRAIPELPGTPPYLRHVALLTGEPPGIPGMPPLDEFVEASFRMGPTAISREDTEAARKRIAPAWEDESPSHARSLDLGYLPQLHLTGGPTMADDKTKTAPGAGDDPSGTEGKSKAPGPNDPNTKARTAGGQDGELPAGYFEDFEAAVERTLKRVLAGGDSELAKAGTKADDPKDRTPSVPNQDIDAEVRAVLTERLGLAPKAASKPDPTPPPAPTVDVAALSRAVSEVVKPLADEIATLRTEREQRNGRERTELVQQVLDRAVSEARMSPAERDTTESLLLSPTLTEDQVRETLKKVAARRDRIPMPTSPSVVFDQESGRSVDVPAELLPPAGSGCLAGDPRKMAVVSRVLGGIEEEDGAKFYQKLRTGLLQEEARMNGGVAGGMHSQLSRIAAGRA